MNSETVTQAVAESNATNGTENVTPVTPPKPQKWTSSAGPIQQGKVRKALEAVQWEGRTFSEISGVIGVSERTFSFTQIFGGQREDSNQALTALGERFGWQVTRENYQDVIAAAGEAVAALVKTRPVKDKRVTAEQQAASDAACKAFEQKRETERKALESQKQAELAEKQKNTPPGLAQDASESVGATGIVVRRNLAKSGVEISFPGKPGREVLDRLKAAGFRWGFHSKVWYKAFGAYAWAQAHTIAGIPLKPSGGVEDAQDAQADADGQTDDLETEAAAYNEQAQIAARAFPSESRALLGELAREQHATPAELPDRFDMGVEDRAAEQCGLTFDGEASFR